MNDPLPVDAMMANLDQSRRFRWYDAYSQHTQLTEEEQRLRDLRHRRSLASPDTFFRIRPMAKWLITKVAEFLAT